MAVRKSLAQIWHFIWEDNSIWSWFANIIIAFVLIKYIIFPLMGLILGSGFPVVAVVSDSMEHNDKFEAWWNGQEIFYKDFNITKEEFSKFIFSSGLDKGDVIVLVSPKNLKIGDIPVFIARDGRPIIHRVVSLNPIQTKGDNNKGQIATTFLNEKDVSKEQFIGKALIRIPWIGYVKIGFAWLVSLFGLHIA